MAACVGIARNKKKARRQGMVILQEGTVRRSGLAGECLIALVPCIGLAYSFSGQDKGLEKKSTADTLAVWLRLKKEVVHRACRSFLLKANPSTKMGRKEA